MPKPNPEAVALLQSLLDDARKGLLQDVFVLLRAIDGSYGYEYTTQDAGDMLYELGTVILLERSAERSIPTQ